MKWSYNAEDAARKFRTGNEGNPTGGVPVLPDLELSPRHFYGDKELAESFMFRMATGKLSKAVLLDYAAAFMVRDSFRHPLGSVRTPGRCMVALAKSAPVERVPLLKHAHVIGDFVYGTNTFALRREPSVMVPGGAPKSDCLVVLNKDGLTDMIVEDESPIPAIAEAVPDLHCYKPIQTPPRLAMKAYIGTGKDPFVFFVVLETRSGNLITLDLEQACMATPTFPTDWRMEDVLIANDPTKAVVLREPATDSLCVVMPRAIGS